MFLFLYFLSCGILTSFLLWIICIFISTSADIFSWNGFFFFFSEIGQNVLLMVYIVVWWVARFMRNLVTIMLWCLSRFISFINVERDGARSCFVFLHLFCALFFLIKDSFKINNYKKNKTELKLKYLIYNYTGKLF